MKLEKLEYEIVGVGRGLMTHNPSQMTATQTGATIGKKKIPTPEEEADRGVYRDEKGIYLPAVAFQRAMIRACSGKKVGKTSAKSVVSGAVLIVQEKCYLVDPRTKKPLTKWEVDIRRVVVQGRDAIMRSRPLFPVWATRVSFEINTDYVAPAALDPIMTEAGIMVGVGDYRPEHTGPFGRFEAKRI
jgi:hypothetical protein